MGKYTAEIAAYKWAKLCRRYRWDAKSEVSLLWEFVRMHDLLPQFIEFAKQEAAREAEQSKHLLEDKTEEPA